MKALDYLLKIHHLVEGKEALNPNALQSKVSEFRRGGLPSASIPEGSRSSELPLPGFDAFDRRLRDGLRRYHNDIEAALNALEAAKRFEAMVLVVPDPLPDPPVIPCANNDHSGGILEPGRKSGECVQCRVHRRRWSLAWPWKPPDEQEVAQ